MLEQHARGLVEAQIRDRAPHPTKIERVDVSFTVELRDGARETITASGWV